MPILRIDVIEGGSEAELKGLLNAIHRAILAFRTGPYIGGVNVMNTTCRWLVLLIVTAAICKNRPGAKCTPFTRPFLAFPCRTRSPGGGESFARFATRDRCYEVVFAR